MGKSFKKIILCHTNDFHSNKNDKIQGWVEHNGGKFSKEITAEVTHLIASEKAWKRYVPIVKEARRLRSIKIVKLEWLEDSLLQPSRRPLSTSKYEFERRSRHLSKKNKFSDKRSSRLGTNTKKIQSNKKSKEETVEETGVKFDKSCREFEKNMENDGYHPYIDKHNFTHMINLVRRDIFDNRVEKHQVKVCHAPLSTYPYPTTLYHFPKTCPFSSRPVAVYDTIKHHEIRVPILKPWAQCLQLYESNSKPHAYACYTQYTNPKSIFITTLAPKDSTWDFASESFKRFFNKKCGFDWETRSKFDGKLKDGVNDLFEYEVQNMNEIGSS